MSGRQEFIVPDGRYSREQFQRCLIEGHDQLFLPSTKHKWIKIHSVRTEPIKWKELLRPYLKRELGDIWHIQLPISSDPSENVNFYIDNYSPELLLFYSCSTNWEYARSLQKFIEETKGLGQMWIGPNKFEDLILDFIDKYHPTVERFFARRKAGDSLPTAAGRDVSRRVDWSSNDGGETIWELKETYGLRPKGVRMRLSEGQVQLNNNGMFVLTRINPKMFEAFQSVMDFVEDEESTITTSSQRVRLGFEQLGDQGRITLPIMTSGSIHLRQARLHSALVDRIRDDQRFEFTVSVAAEGSFSWIAEVVDRQKSSIFGISSDEQIINLIPRFNVTFESFLDFYHQILERVDSSATFNTLGAVIG